MPELALRLGTDAMHDAGAKMTGRGGPTRAAGKVDQQLQQHISITTNRVAFHPCLLARRRPNWSGKMRNFFEVQVVPIDDLLAMARSSSSLPTARVLASWLARVLNTEPGEGALCLSCDAEFRGQPSWLAMVAAPFASEGKALISGICPDCAEHPDLEGVVIEWLRHGAMPDLEVVTTGSRS